MHAGAVAVRWFNHAGFFRRHHGMEDGDASRLAMKAPRVDKTADAEMLFSETWVSDELYLYTPHTVYARYRRIKIFTERGRDR